MKINRYILGKKKNAWRRVQLRFCWVERFSPRCCPTFPCPRRESSGSPLSSQRGRSVPARLEPNESSTLTKTHWLYSNERHVSDIRLSQAQQGIWWLHTGSCFNISGRLRHLDKPSIQRPRTNPGSVTRGNTLVCERLIWQTKGKGIFSILNLSLLGHPVKCKTKKFF